MKVYGRDDVKIGEFELMKLRGIKFIKDSSITVCSFWFQIVNQLECDIYSVFGKVKLVMVQAQNVHINQEKCCFQPFSQVNLFLQQYSW